MGNSRLKKDSHKAFGKAYMYDGNVMEYYDVWDNEL